MCVCSPPTKGLNMPIKFPSTSWEMQNSATSSVKSNKIVEKLKKKLVLLKSQRAFYENCYIKITKSIKILCALFELLPKRYNAKDKFADLY